MMNATRLVLVSALGLGMIACSSSSDTPTNDNPKPDASLDDHDSGKGSGTGSGKGSGTGTGSGSGSGSSNLTDVSGFCTALLGAEATLLSRCLGGPESSWEAQLSGDSSCTEFAAAASAGRINYDPSQASTCLSDYGALGCADLANLTEPAACTATVTGKVGANGVCYDSVDCNGSSFCSGLGGSSGACSGTCKPLLAAGASCAAGDECVTGYTCSGSSGAMTCTMTTAATQAGAGGTCGYQKTSMTIIGCETGLSCNAATLVCVTTVQEGGACTPGAGVCEIFTSCDPTSKTCKLDPGVGGKCGSADGQDVIPCAGPTYCKTTGTSLAGTCAALLGSGAACNEGYECASETCNGATDAGAGVCTAACTQE